MSRPFTLNAPIGPNYNVDLDDTLRAKKALKSIGYYEIPSYGLTPYPDDTLFRGIRRFQRQSGLLEDGTMKPGGETAAKLGKRLINGTLPQKDRKTAVRILGLSDDVGRGRANRHHDILSVKRTLAWAGHYPASPTRTNDGHADNELFDAIASYQERSGRTVDGWLRPHGETEEALNLELSPPIHGDTHDRDSRSRRDEKQNPEVAAAAAPPIAYKIAEYFGMALMAAWAWWQSLSNAEKDKVRAQMSGAGPSRDREDQCDYLHYQVDIPTCRAIKESRGDVAAQRCYASANQRYAQCLKGVPINRLPPLDIWNN